MHLFSITLLGWLLGQHVPPKEIHIPKTTVWVIIGAAAGGLHCDKHGCIGPDGYWSGTDKVYTKGMPLGWSPNWKDGKQYRSGDPDPNYDIPNGRHCCYVEDITPINSRTGRVDWTGFH